MVLGEGSFHGIICMHSGKENGFQNLWRILHEIMMLSG